MDTLEQYVLEPTEEFILDSKRFITKCNKPNQKEYNKTIYVVLIGFAILGFCGYFIKLVHIPITGLLMSSE
ncbi:SEC61 complex gamma subunit, putative [Entamoeba histolytica HM-1:IMSS-B]|uniref:Protein transport protein SEC61 gamma subunit, putative n=8 Tax=Entamoeba TaxID=5758 RepID=C4LZS0_ENTH1|nr:protein translocase SEC61 complex gamma subunit, archaeal and eukaryotic protein [Entamoeba nuttalli P19]XP_656834.1 Protein transport protein SEC61 gamma subunit, putative [Entamoeba histolytica HM-1:IMSS]EMD44894.1 SEC61 gamma subunit, putative [Entamoeba histolytica KU27]EMH76852.1 SEC61 complex gamma subunit, putative [Entamoeba histolytica HM-1:IMSS-B]EMS15068.1 sec61 gamma subunit, putative [Entamoeba histolytica HM-3:IMSS]ENY65717.1 protein transport protein sec61 gamma subunit, puta|eukprot:XP_008857858.1 protein translocase SEC61 complex gamma subunit, archaeal and eukaryotic protein [Entamoeba nuttalli P19]